MSHLRLQIGTALVVPLAAAPWRTRALREAALDGSDGLFGAAPNNPEILPRPLFRMPARYAWRRAVRFRPGLRGELWQ